MQSNCGVHKKFTNRRKKDGTAEAVPSSPIFSLVGVHQIVENDFLRPVADIVHVSHPGHGIGGFQGLGHTLSLGNLLDEISALSLSVPPSRPAPWRAASSEALTAVTPSARSGAGVRSVRPMSAG